MLLEFKIYELIEGSRHFDRIGEPNKFILVGEEENYYKAHQVKDGAICCIPGFMLDEATYIFPKEEVRVKPDKKFPGAVTVCEFNIPKEMLTMEIIETIQRLND